VPSNKSGSISPALGAYMTALEEVGLDTQFHQPDFFMAHPALRPRR
jgi:hypothetical protein